MILDLDLLVNAFVDKLRRREEESGQLGTLPRNNPVKPPWETWELDEAFFTALTRWTLENPETSLDRALDKIYIGLETAQDLFILIPDKPFPARGLVTALAHLFKLGVTISRAKKDVQAFAKDVVNWVGQVKLAFESAKGGRFTGSAWRDLRKMRDLVEEICRWAVARLEDGRWARVGHGLMIQKEIGEFRARIVDARALFQDLSAINFASGLDGIKRDLWALLNYQHGILAEIKKVRKSQERQLSHIIDEMEAQKEAAAREQFFSEVLAARVVTNPTYDQQGKRPCDPDTRVEVLDIIRSWVDNIKPGSPNFLWLTGDPGCGKSAITASLARECKDRGILWAQFFINRNNAETTNPNAYFPSIARQLATRSPDVARVIHDTLKGRLSLTDAISSEQAAKLFINSIQVASRLEPAQPVVVVIDGLDETDRSRLKDTATIFSTLFRALPSHSNVKVFISSRTEDEIRNPFSRPLHNKHVKRVHLDTSDPSSIRDVCTFILRSLREIVEEHDLNWEVWPGELRAGTLGTRAAGLFIWATTAVKFVQEQLDSHGAECLNDVLDMLTADNLDDINALYELILRITFRSNASEWEFERFRRIIGAIVFLQEPLCLDDLAELLDLRKAQDNVRVDMLHFIRRLRTVLVSGTAAIDAKTIPRLHKSFFEFITSTRVDARFRVDPEYAHLELAVQCLRHMSDTHTFIRESMLPTAIRYAFRFWSSHVSHTRQKAGVAVLDESLFDIASLFRSAGTIGSPLILQLSSSKSEIESTLLDTTRIWDMASGQDITDQRKRASGIAFSPDGKQVVSCSTDQSLMFWSTTNNECLRKVLYSSPLLAVAFSPDGKYIVSGSSDHTLCLWNAHTGLSVGLPFRGHTGPVTCVAFSPDGTYIVSGSADKTCRLWSVETGQPIGDPFADNAGVSSVAFDQLSGYFYFGTDNGTIQCRSHQHGQKSTINAHNEKVTAIACSANATSGRLISGSKKGGVVYWLEGPVGIPVTKHAGTVLCVAFPDGKHVFSGSNNTICVSTAGGPQLTESYRPTVGKRGTNPNQVTALAFSSDTKYFACAGGTTVSIYKLRFLKDRFQLDIVPVETPPLTRGPLHTPSTDTTPSDDVQAFRDELSRVLLGVEEEGWTYDGEVRNGRLEGTRWFKPKLQSNTDGSSVLWARCGNRLVRADSGDGSVAVWDQNDDSQ